MRDLLPQQVLDAIGHQYRKAVQAGVEDYLSQQADEDAVTGSFGGAVRALVHGTVLTANGTFKWRSSSKKLRGRGPHAPEKRIGIDAIIELEIWDDSEELIGVKVLPFQGKNEWSGKDKLLPSQADLMSKIPGGGLVVDYRATSFEAVTAEAAAKAHGDRNRVTAASFRDFGAMLAEDFLECRVGTRNAYYDATREIMIFSDLAGVLTAHRMSAARRILTRVDVGP